MSCKKIRKFAKKIDIYAKPIQLTYKGKEKYRSTLGGAFSLIILMFLASIFLYKLQLMIFRKNTQIKNNTIV